MIVSFADKKTRKVWNGEYVRSWPAEIQQRALIKLRLVSAAASLEDLKIPPGNQLEALKGDRLGQFSIRINSQWRICFRWENNDAHAVEIVDYH